MDYILENCDGRIYGEKNEFIQNLSVNDDDVRCDNDEPVFSFTGDIGVNTDKFFLFNIDLKDAIRLRNALNSFIEIQKIK